MLGILESFGSRSRSHMNRFAIFEYIHHPHLPRSLPYLIHALINLNPSLLRFIIMANHDHGLPDWETNDILAYIRAQSHAALFSFLHTDSTLAHRQDILIHLPILPVYLF